MQQPRILIVEDETAIAELLMVNLRHNGYHITWAADGAAARQAMQQQRPDLVLLDWMLPGESGIALAQHWRADDNTRSVPIILLTARSAEHDRVAGLDAGADDYICKPFSVKELLARIRAVLRRQAPVPAQTELELGQLTLNPETYQVRHADRLLKLGPTEFKLLHHFMRHAHRVYSRAQLLEHVWGRHAAIEERTVDVHIKRLREALGDAADMLETVRGIGYRITTKD